MQLIPSCHSFMSNSFWFAESKPFPKSIRTDSVRLLEPTEVYGTEGEGIGKFTEAVRAEVNECVSQDYRSSKVPEQKR